MKTLGVLTIGQSPRPDIMEDIIPVFGGNIELLEAGALDGMTKEEISALQPGETDRLLVTKLSNGEVVQVAEAALMQCMQEKINLLEEKGVDCILILCTARFQGLHSHVACIEPGTILSQTVPKLAPHSYIGVVSPDAAQVKATKRDWDGIVERIEVLTASPYGSERELEETAKGFRAMDVDLIVLDCMGYSEVFREQMEVLSGKAVILSKVLAAEKTAELLEG